MMNNITQAAPNNQLVHWVYLDFEKQFRAEIQIQTAPPLGWFKQFIFDNFELFLLFVLLFQLLTSAFIVWRCNARQKRIQEASVRKESTASDDYSNNSHAEEDANARQDRSSSTESSPKVNYEARPRDIAVQALACLPENGQQISQDPILVKQISQKSYEIEHDPKSKTFTKIETNTKISQFKSTPELEMKILEEIQGQVQVDGEIRGMKHVEMQDHISGQATAFRYITTEFDKYCETGKFGRMYCQQILLGKGAFGEVYSAFKHLDQKTYAIKRIFFRVSTESNLRDHKIFREIQALIDINHKNIVRYFTSWVEELDQETLKKIQELNEYVSQKQNEVKPESPQNSFYLDDDEAYLDDMIQFNGGEKSQSKQSRQTQKNSERQLVQCLGNQNYNNSFHYSDYSSVNQSLMRRLQYNPTSQSQPFILYIEMELCERTLKDFIDGLDRGKEGDMKLTRQIFRQMLEGIDFMHQRNYIHRDLKPQNIFINSKNEVKIGDLGLSLRKFKEQENLDGILILESQQSCNIGTPAYMAPEVQNNQPYGSSADIFAIGIMLFELFWSMKTVHQRYRLIQELTREGLLPPKLLSQHPKEAQMILRMTSKDPSKRPSAREVLAQLFENHI